MRALQSRLRIEVAGLALVCLTGIGIAACSDVLNVEAPGVLTSDELTGPGAIPNVVNGIIGDFGEAYDDYVRYSSMFTDEMILAGTFPTRREVDNRQINPDNATLTGELYEPLHTARFAADTAVVNFTAVLTDPDFADVTALLEQGIAIGKFYGAYTRVLLAELYCESTISRGPYLLSDDRMQEALSLFVEAEQDAAAAGLPDVELAAIVGQARAHLWLGNTVQARTEALRVADSGFVYFADYSENDPVQFNEVHSLTWGRGQQVIRWTVGDGSLSVRSFERWPYFVEWAQLGLLDTLPDPDDFESFDSGIPVKLQLLYSSGSVPVRLASKAEADLIVAEVDFLEGNTTRADSLVNFYRAAWGLPNISFAGLTQAQGLTQMAQERAREMWLTGDRQATLRRYFEQYTLDLYPTKPGTQTSFPVVQQERDNNPNPRNPSCP